MTKQVVKGCTSCGLDIELVPFERVEQYIVNGVRIPVRSTIYQCPTCKDVVIVPTGIDNLELAYRKYETLTGRKILRKEL